MAKTTAKHLKVEISCPKSSVSTSHCPSTILQTHLEECISCIVNYIHIAYASLRCTAIATLASVCLLGLYPALFGHEVLISSSSLVLCICTMVNLEQ